MDIIILPIGISTSPVSSFEHNTILITARRAPPLFWKFRIACWYVFEDTTVISCPILVHQ